MNKKAISQIVTTILIILLVLAAIVIVWQAVKGTVETGTEGMESRIACMEIGLEVTEADANTNAIKIHRLAGGKSDAVTSIRIIVDGEVVEFTDPADGPGLEPLETKEYALAWDWVSRTYPLTSAGQEVKAAAVLGSGENQVFCNPSSLESSIDSIPDSVEVIGDVCAGTYSKDATFDGRPTYKHEDSDYYIFFWKGTETWYIYTKTNIFPPSDGSPFWSKGGWEGILGSYGYYTGDPGRQVEVISLS